MCRLTAYLGPEIALEYIIVTPSHSLFEQSQAATEAKLSTNGDGFGISWYGDDQIPGLYRDVLPAWSDGNLPNLCRMVKSHLFLAHVRASTVGEVTRVNCLPKSTGPLRTTAKSPTSRPYAEPSKPPSQTTSMPNAVARPIAKCCFCSALPTA